MRSVFGAGTAWHDLVHAALLEYIPFIVLLFALFTISGGLLVVGNLHGSPGTNTALLGIGTFLASVIGTTGASMVLIRPLLRANDNRRFNVHTVIFFIFLVSNIGGSLSPLGDPPLFLGFLQGVDFFWTTIHLAPETVLPRRHPAQPVLRDGPLPVRSRGQPAAARSDTRHAPDRSR